MSERTNIAKPVRIQLSRRKGWLMPPNTVKVDRSTKWGNPFEVRRDGSREECVRLFAIMLSGHICISVRAGLAELQRDYTVMAKGQIKSLRGKNLACWCPLDKPCHADVLLEIANEERAKVK